jgi:hypothetical protein
VGNLREDYRSACSELAVTWQQGDRVIAVSGTPEHSSQAPLHHYLRKRPEVIASISSVADYLSASQTPARSGTGGALHVIYRERWYAAPDLERITRTHRQVHAGPMRVGIQHLVFERN